VILLPNHIGQKQGSIMSKQARDTKNKFVRKHRRRAKPKVS